MNIKIIRIITFIKTKFDKSDDQTNHIKINITTNHYYKLLWSSETFEVKYNIGFGIPIDFPSQRKKIVKSVHKQEIGLVWPSETFEGKYNIGSGIPIEFPSLREKK